VNALLYSRLPKLDVLETLLANTQAQLQILRQAAPTNPQARELIPTFELMHRDLLASCQTLWCAWLIEQRQRKGRTA
jgi:hypothetical protein